MITKIPRIVAGEYVGSLYLDFESVGALWDWLPKGHKQYFKQTVLTFKQGGRIYLEGYDADEVALMFGKKPDVVE